MHRQYSGNISPPARKNREGNIYVPARKRKRIHLRNISPPARKNKEKKNVGKFSELFQTRNPDPDLSNGIFVVDIFSPQKLWIHLSYNF